MTSYFHINAMLYSFIFCQLWRAVAVQKIITFLKLHYICFLVLLPFRISKHSRLNDHLNI